MANYTLSLADTVGLRGLFGRDVDYKRGFSASFQLSSSFLKGVTLFKTESLLLTGHLFKEKRMEFQEHLPVRLVDFSLEHTGDMVGFVAQSLGFNPVTRTVFPPDLDNSYLGYNPIKQVVYPPELVAKRTDFHRFVDFVGQEKVSSAIEFLQEHVSVEYEELETLRQSLGNNTFPENMEEDIDLEVK